MLNEHVRNNHDSSMYCEMLDESTVFVVPVAAFSKLMAEDFELAKNVIEIQEEGKVYLLFQEEEFRLVVFGDENSK